MHLFVLESTDIYIKIYTKMLLGKFYVKLISLEWDACLFWSVLYCLCVFRLYVQFFV
jgi:hypothetical protein